MNLRDLEYFIAVVELKNFSRAAERCFVSQPALSSQIRKLEETLDVQLFERSNRHVLVTDIGSRLAIHARAILQEKQNMFELAKSVQNPLAGECRLGAFPTLASYFFPQVVASIRASLPELRLILVEEKTHVLIERLQSGALDAAFLALPVEEDGLQGQALFDDPFVVAVPSSHPMGQKKAIAQSHLRDTELLLLEEGHCLRDQSLSVCQVAGANEYQDFRATSLETLRQMVKAGSGITLFPSIAMETDDAGLRYIPFEAPVPCRTIGLFWRKTTARTTLMKALIHLFQDSGLES